MTTDKTTQSEELHGKRREPEGVRVCFASLEFPPDWGGVSKSARRITRMLSEAGYDVHVFAPLVAASLGTNPPPEKVSGITLHRVRITRDLSHESLLALYQAIASVDQKTPFDVFHGFYLPMSYPFLMLMRQRWRPLITSIRGDDGVLMLEGQSRGMCSAILNATTCLTSLSTDGIERACELSDIRPRSRFIHNSPAYADPRRWSLSEANKGVVGTVCTFRRKKNLPSLINAYFDMPPDLRSQLLFVGEAPANDDGHKAELLDLIARRDTRNETKITGYIENDDVPDFMMDMNVFVMCSLHEGFPNTILEAAQAGVPIVATDVDGVKDMRTAGLELLVVPPDDAPALSRAIASVLGNPDLAQRLSSVGIQLAERFSREREKQAWLSVYERALSAKAR